MTLKEPNSRRMPSGMRGCGGVAATGGGWGSAGLAETGAGGHAGRVADDRCFDCLDLWRDPVARDGPHNMAVDEWLLEHAKRPLLRVYGWAGNWVSCGCFVRLTEVRREFPAAPAVPCVRRWTGGGIVDHRGDWTYSLIVPSDWVAGLGRPRDSYRRIHAALANALRAERVSAFLVAAEQLPADGHGACFRQPVAGDLVGPGEAKQAGAAQRRTRCGLLHQGSVRVAGAEPPAMAQRSRSFGEFLAREVEMDPAVAIEHAAVETLVESRYGNPDWLTRW